VPSGKAIVKKRALLTRSDSSVGLHASIEQFFAMGLLLRQAIEIILILMAQLPG
jgi:hypothetical protein